MASYRTLPLPDLVGRIVAMGFEWSEVFGGYSFFRTEGDANLNGWAASFAARLTGGLELVGDLSGHYGSVDIGLTKADVDAHTVLFGPRFGGGRRAGSRPFAHALAGLTRVGAGVDLFGARISG